MLSAWGEAAILIELCETHQQPCCRMRDGGTPAPTNAGKAQERTRQTGSCASFNAEFDLTMRSVPKMRRPSPGSRSLAELVNRPAASSGAGRRSISHAPRIAAQFQEETMTHVCYCVTQHNAPLERIDCPTPQPKAAEVLLRVTAAGVCHSDIHIWEGVYDLGSGDKLTLKDRGISLPLTMAVTLSTCSFPTSATASSSAR
jgi:hypothetical protein